MSQHRCDWRVEPNQLIVSVGTEVHVRVQCAECNSTGTVHSVPNARINPDDVRTWRRYASKAGDAIREDR